MTMLYVNIILNHLNITITFTYKLVDIIYVMCVCIASRSMWCRSRWRAWCRARSWCACAARCAPPRPRSRRPTCRPARTSRSTTSWVELTLPISLALAVKVDTCSVDWSGVGQTTSFSFSFSLSILLNVGIRHEFLRSLCIKCALHKCVPVLLILFYLT